MVNLNCIEQPQNIRPHIVLLGAGASRATFSAGDADQRILPTMNDLIKTLNLQLLLDDCKINLNDNFEKIYSEIKSVKIKNAIELKIYEYFSDLTLPKKATDYDRLLLSLRRKDAVFTFNWDPLLFDAYERNRHICDLPEIFFLHGNVRIGSCKLHDVFGNKNQTCPSCDQKFDKVPLLFPIEKKEYFNANQYIKNSWESAKYFFSNAFMITIFGYSAPSSDIEAVNLLRSAWFEKSKRTLEHVEVIDIIDCDEINQRWGYFCPTNHLQSRKSLKESWLWHYPRRSCEAVLGPMSTGIPTKFFDLPKTNNLASLQKFIKEISKYE